MRQKVFSIHALLIGLLSMMSTTAYAASYTPADLTGTGIDLEIGDVVTINDDDTGVNYGSNSIGKGRTITILSDGTLEFVANSGTYNWGLAAGKKWHIQYVERDLGFMKTQDIYLTQVEPKVAVTGITLDKSEAAMTVGGDALTLTATVAPNDATDKTVTWTTSDANVATVADGVVTAVAAGTATITATATNGTPDDTSDDKTATCAVTVTEPAAAIFTIDTDGTTQDFGSVEVDATAQKTFTVTNNGNATLNVSFAATGDFTVTDPASSRKFWLTDNFGWGTGYAYAWDSKGKALLGEWPGTACGNTTNDYGETMFVVTVPSNAAGVIVNNGNGAQTVDITNFTQGYWMDGTLDGSGHYTVEGYEGGSEETPAVLTVAAGESETFTVAMNTATLGSKSGNITLSFDAKNATSFTIPCTGETVSNPTVTANPGGDGNYWSTYYNATKSFTADENTTVYKAALNGTSSVTLTEVTGREIPVGQAVILKSTTGTITLTPAATTADMSGNVLKGGTTVTDGYDAYTLSRGSDSNGAVGFYKYSGSLDGSKAHLEIPTSAGSRGFIGFGDDNTTGIELPALADDEAAEWYSLDGRRLSGKPARKGIYVKDGQKYIIK